MKDRNEAMGKGNLFQKENVPALHCKSTVLVSKSEKKGRKLGNCHLVNPGLSSNRIHSTSSRDTR